MARVAGTFISVFINSCKRDREFYNPVGYCRDPIPGSSWVGSLHSSSWESVAGYIISG
ncbi:hypothetical protein C723_3314 [Christiangramia flava JLT2011]|uniref:Uncharacterized protein n=1 Tax=Christiangramia flava JLT2011 TaxID=1229726 RepID=A0A1L7I8C2_9FLAO|nr:hypothetical protein GRFL_3115 [Christiangramia flava JLT2011]OSS37845.1 hypothetical protein C723_3314 [Christiangramia flava JLT2011]